MKNSVIEVKDFRKTYGNYVAVDGISFDVKQGEIFGLLGPQWRWKDQHIGMLGRTAHSKRWLVAGGRLRPSQRVPQTTKPDRRTATIGGITGKHHARRSHEILLRLSQRGAPLRLAGTAGPGRERSAQFYELSAGQQRRLVLALAVAHNPQVLFLDEPTAGLDVATRVELHGMMRELQAGGTTIILATHDMAEAEQMSDQVAILMKSRIVNIGTPMEITATGAGLTKISVRTQASSLSASGITFPAVSQHTSKRRIQHLLQL